MAWKGRESRQFVRVCFPCIVKLVSPQGVPETILTHTENIGQGGLCIIVKQEIKLATPVALEIDLLDLGEHLHLKGKVVWNVDRKADEKLKPLFHSVGIEFIDLTRYDIDRLQKNIQLLIKNSI